MANACDKVDRGERREKSWIEGGVREWRMRVGQRESALARVGEFYTPRIPSYFDSVYNVLFGFIPFRQWNMDREPHPSHAMAAPPALSALTRAGGATTAASACLIGTTAAHLSPSSTEGLQRSGYRYLC